MRLIYSLCGIFSLLMSIQILAKDSIKFYDMPTKLINEHLQIYQGGFGSDATGDPSNNKRFYALTDRGPNLSGKEKGSKIFPIPDYTPSIGYFEITQDNSINLLKLIELKTPAGKNLTGLPNPEGLGAIDEVALDMMGNSLGTDKYGIDSEGLVVAQDGTFWIADEYGPHLIHFNGEGIELERISPYGVNTGKRKLPAVFAQRRANRGMEGLTMTPDQSSLVGIMQSTLFNPTKQEAINRTLTRIIMFDLKSGETKQFLYKQNADNFSNSSIIALSNSQFLVGERDGKFASEGTEVQKHVYLIDITNATDVSGDVKSKTGMLLNGKALEQLSWDELEKVGINAVEKKLVLDLVKENGYPHDKFEGMWLIDQHHLAVINDDDFGIASDKGNMVHKMLPNTTIRDHSRVYIYPISLD